MQLASKNVGSILMFTGMLIFQELSIDAVSWIFAVFPILGLLGMLLTKESPIFHLR